MVSKAADQEAVNCQTADIESGLQAARIRPTSDTYGRARGPSTKRSTGRKPTGEVNLLRNNIAAGLNRLTPPLVVWQPLRSRHQGRGAAPPGFWPTEVARFQSRRSNSSTSSLAATCLYAASSISSISSQETAASSRSRATHPRNP